MSGAGYKGIMGIRQQAAYRTALAPQTGQACDKVLLLSENIENEFVNAMHEHLAASAGIPGVQRMFEPSGGGFEIDLNYEEITSTAAFGGTLPIALAMGANAWDAGNGVNQLTFADDLTKNCTIAWEKDVSVWEAVGVYFPNLTISGEENGFIKAAFDVLPYDLLRGGTTSSANLSGLPTDDVQKLSFNEGVFRIGDQAGALAAGDKTGIQSFTVSINNNIVGAQQTTPDNTASHTDALQTIEPKRNRFRETTLEIVVPRYDADTFLDFEANATHLQADLVFTETGGSNYKTFFFPNLFITKISASIPGPDLITQTITFQCLLYNSAASDLVFADASTDAGELWIETKDERSGAILS